MVIDVKCSKIELLVPLLEDEQESKCGVLIIDLKYVYFDIYRLAFGSCLEDLRCII